jgi:hypothetical protein
MIFEQKHKDALLDLVRALDNICDLCNEEGKGNSFNDEILTEKLHQCWGMSIDEMAMEIRGVAENMETEN